MATIRKLRGRWQAQVRRRGMKPRAKSFDSKLEAEKWARDLEAQVDRFGSAPDTKNLETTTLHDLLERCQREVSPTKCGFVQESQQGYPSKGLTRGSCVLRLFYEGVGREAAWILVVRFGTGRCSRRPRTTGRGAGDDRLQLRGMRRLQGVARLLRRGRRPSCADRRAHSSTKPSQPDPAQRSSPSSQSPESSSYPSTQSSGTKLNSHETQLPCRNAAGARTKP